MTGLVAGTVLITWAGIASAQIFNSGSTGADGALTVSSTTTLALPADGVFNFTTVTVQSGAALSFTPNAANTPVTILATGDVFIFGSITVNGANGVNAPFVAAGGPSGFPGGVGGTPPAGGAGPGGGLPSGSGGSLNALYGAGSNFGTLLPLFGGSGGGGGILNPFGQASSGGGGGGAIVIASNTRVDVAGSITHGIRVRSCNRTVPCASLAPWLGRCVPRVCASSAS